MQHEKNLLISMKIVSFFFLTRICYFNQDIALLYNLTIFMFIIFVVFFYFY